MNHSRGQTPGVIVSPDSLATSSADGSLDASPRGGPPGFVRVHVALTDLDGSNLIASRRGVVTTGRAALLVLVPGKDETLRINGQEQEYADDLALDTPES